MYALVCHWVESVLIMTLKCIDGNAIIIFAIKNSINVKSLTSKLVEIEKCVDGHTHT